jgi:hypothetical protein
MCLGNLLNLVMIIIPVLALAYILVNRYRSQIPISIGVWLSKNQLKLHYECCVLGEVKGIKVCMQLDGIQSLAVQKHTTYRRQY